MRTVVGVLRGGPSLEYEESLKSGASVLEHIDRERFDPRDIFIDKQGVWHLHGLAVPPERALYGVDVAFNALHHSTIGRLLERLAVPHTGPDAFATQLSDEPYLLKQRVRALGLRVPHTAVVEQGEPGAVAHQLFRSFPQPSYINGAFADRFDTLQAHVARALGEAPRVVVEEHIAGRAASVGVIRGFRNQPVYALIPAPQDLPAATKNELVAAAQKIHGALALGHYAHIDFIVSRRGLYVVGSSAHPPLHNDSAFAAGLKTVGSSLKEFISHVIELARRR